MQIHSLVSKCFQLNLPMGGLLDRVGWFTLQICCYCRSPFVWFLTELRSFPQQQPMWTKTHTSEGIQNVMIQEDLHYSLRCLANVCLCVSEVGGWVKGDGVGGNRVQENHIHMVEQLHRAPFSIGFYHQHNSQIPHSPPNLHMHTHSWCIGK